ncbi:hypothetical protein BDW59DRAFT_161115 [Aspergillus cavernicola]|uniref:Uncharacterized protein n=1 Tax=Aspergillus cavernicola TaxID=176166 RepID=A0ABR4IF94_9EURO
MRFTKHLLLLFLFIAGIALSAPSQFNWKPRADGNYTGIEVTSRGFVIPNPVVPKPVIPKPVVPKPVVPKPDIPNPANGPASQPCKRAGACDWDDLVQDGARKENDLARALDEHHERPSTWDRFTTEYSVKELGAEPVPGEVSSAMHKDGFRVEQVFDYAKVEVRNTQGQGSKLMGFFDYDGEAVIITNVVSGRRSEMHLSEMLANSLTRCSPGGDQGAALKFIYLAKIVNPETTTIMREAVRKAGGGTSQTFTPRTPGFHALLASPNGRIVPSMLTDHARSMGERIDKIRIDLDQRMMIFDLK